MTGPEDTLARLRSVCDAAPQGRWRYAYDDDRGPAVEIAEGDTIVYPVTPYVDEESAESFAVFVATFDPPMVRALLRVYQEARGIFLEGCRCGLCEAVSDVDAALAGVPAPEDSPAEKEQP